MTEKRKLPNSNGGEFVPLPVLEPVTDEERVQQRAALGLRIRARRQACAVTQEMLAAALGVDRSWISRLEAGAVTLTTDKAGALGRLLQIPASAFIDGVDSE